MKQGGQQTISMFFICSQGYELHLTRDSPDILPLSQRPVSVVQNVTVLWISRNFFSICYPGVTQREFASRVVQKENPPSH